MAGPRTSRKGRKKRQKKRSGGIRWGKVLGIFSGVVALLLVVGAFAVYFGIKSYLHSDKFRAMLSEKTSDFFKAEGEFEPFSWTGTTAYSNTYRGDGYENAKFSKVKAEGIEAEVNLKAAKRGVWEITRVDVQQLNALVNGERLERQTSSDEGEAVPAGKGGGFLSRFIPKKVEILKTRIARTNFNFEQPGGGDLKLMGRGIGLEITPSSTEGISKVAGHGGTLDVEPLPENLRRLKIGEFNLRAGSGKLFIDNAAALFPNAGEGRVLAAGEIGGDETPTRLSLKISEIPAGKVVGPDWVKRLSGMVGGQIEVERRAGGEERQPLVIEGNIAVTDAVLEALPVLERLDEMLNSTKFRRLLLEVLSARFEKRGGRIDLREFHLESAGTVCVKGAFGYEGSRVMSGRYMAGITPDTIRWLPEWKKKIINQVFRMERDTAFSEIFGDDPDAVRPPEGYRWTVVAVDPAAKEPYSADLRRQFIEAGGLAIWAEIEGLSGKAIEVAADVAKAATEQGVNLLDVITGESRTAMFTEEGMLRLGGILSDEDSEDEDGRQRRRENDGGLLRIPNAVIEGGFDLLMPRREP